MPSTTRQSIRYPASSDSPNGPQQMLNLASDVDARPSWRGVASAYPGNIAVGDTFYHMTLRCTMRAMTTGGSWKQADIVFVTDAADRVSYLASVTAAGLTLHEGFLVWQDDTNILYASSGGNTLVTVQAQPTRGTATLTTDASGLAYINHGLGATPAQATLTPVYTNDTVSQVFKATRGTLTSTQIQLVAFRTDTSSRLVNTQVVVDWVAWP